MAVACRNKNQAQISKFPEYFSYILVCCYSPCECQLLSRRRSSSGCRTVAPDFSAAASLDVCFPCVADVGAAGKRGEGMVSNSFKDYTDANDMSHPPFSLHPLAVPVTLRLPSFPSPRLPPTRTKKHCASHESHHWPPTHQPQRVLPVFWWDTYPNDCDDNVSVPGAPAGDTPPGASHLLPWWAGKRSPTGVAVSVCQHGGYPYEHTSGVGANMVAIHTNTPAVWVPTRWPSIRTAVGINTVA